ncbi:MAG: hypothetical protein NTY86_17170 [Deltaproteobacteria bacterium]|nr:hypothetical protein [Deltaproteobacteria bacterium]
MKFKFCGREFSTDENDPPVPLEPAIDADQKHPRRYYVYAHLDSSGQIFYIGKGTGRRAWSTVRHPLWSRCVEKHLNGEYKVKILRDNLAAEDIDEVEDAWIAQYSNTVVNLFNVWRDRDFKALAWRNGLRDELFNLMRRAKAIKKVDLEKAIFMYFEAMEAIKSFAFITCEGGLVGQLLNEEAEELGVCGKVDVLNRLTICLIKLGRPEEAARHTEKYFELYRRDLQFGAAKRITERVSKALARKQKPK